MSATSDPPPRPRPRWRLADLLGLVLFAAVALATYRESGPSNTPLRNTSRLGAFLATVATATVCAFRAPRPWRPFWEGWAVFGWLYLVVVLHGNFGVDTLAAAAVHSEWALLGIPLGLLAGLACRAFSAGDPGPGRP